MANPEKPSRRDLFKGAALAGHEVQNLGIVGGSVMGTSGARNPTLTDLALAWRTAQHLAGNWKSRTA